MNMHETSAVDGAAKKIVEVSGGGKTYRMVLPHADRDYIQRKVATEQAPYELDMLLDMKERLGEGDIVLDAGANVGNHTLFLAAVANCHVVAFEPNTELASAVRESAQLNGLESRVDIRTVGLGRQHGFGHFASSIPDNLGAQSIVADGGPLEIQAIDSLALPGPVKAIKIDVEGMEIDVLAGAAALVERDRPILYVECSTDTHFRQIHNWMTARNYGYWDTFNATPTHLFLPNEQTTVDQRLSRLQLKANRDIYLTSQQLLQARQQLDAANLKYRGSTEQVANLKVQLAKEERARHDAEAARAEVLQQLEATRERLENERDTLQNDIKRLGAAGDTHLQARHEAEMQLARLETSLQTVNRAHADMAKERQLLQDEVQRLGKSGEDAATSLRALTQANTQLIAERQRLDGEIQRLSKFGEDVAATLQVVNNTNAKLLADRQDVEAEVQRLNKVSAEANASLQAVTETNARLLAERQEINGEIQRLKKFGEELTASLQTVTDTNAQLLTERQEIDNEVKRLNKFAEEMAASLKAVADTNAQLLAERRNLESEVQRLSKLGDELTASLQTVSDSNAQLLAERRDVEDEVKRLNTFAEEMAASLKAVADTNAGLLAERKNLEDHVARLSKLGEEDAARLRETAQRLSTIEAELGATAEALAASDRQRIEARSQVSALEQRVLQEEHAASAAQRLWADAMDDVNRLQRELDALRETHAAATAKMGALDDLARQSTQTRERVEKELASARAELEETRRSLTNANMKYRESSAAARDRQHDINRLKIELGASRRAEGEAVRTAAAARKQALQAEQQVQKTRATLSFRLGYILIHSFKSFRGVMGLPGELLAWRKEVVQRRKQKGEREQKLRTVAQAGARGEPLRPAAPVVAAPAASATPVIARMPGTAPVQPAPAATAPAAAPAPVVQPAIAAMEQPQTLPMDLRRLKVAAIMDEFTFGSYRAECNLQQLTPADWQAELEQFAPELLFIESAWRGKDELWGSKVGHNSQELQGIVAWCRARKVPTVFWNKEDPVHFETFLSTASMFDFVFTTDIDCIHRYKAALGHDRVYLLPFACQPANNHPIETYERKDAFCFAGAYYARYPERTRDLGNFVSQLPSFRPLEIYDRNFGKDDSNYQFPPEYQPYIVGTLPFDQIDKAYKGYRYAINLNSIKQSQSMFARRVFELLASNTITVSNYSRGVRLMFGDLVVTTDSGEEMVRHLREVADDQVRGSKLRLAALRKVLQEHTYQQRFAYVYSKVSGKAPADPLPAIAMLATADSQDELDAVLAHFRRQRYARRTMQVVLGRGFVPSAATRTEDGVDLVPADTVSTIGALAGQADFVAGISARDYYGPHYLTDIALGTLYSQADLIGKGAHYVLRNGKAELESGDLAYRPAVRLAARSAAIRVARIASESAAAWLAALPHAELASENGLAVDEFNYCREGGAGAPATMGLVQEAVDDMQGLYTGIGIDELLSRAEAIPPAAEQGEGARMLSGAVLSTLFGKRPSAALNMQAEGEAWRVESTLPDGKHEYLYATQDVPVEELGWDDRMARFYFDTTPGLNLQLVVNFIDAQKQKISHVIKQANRNHEVELPLGTVAVRFALRVYAGGQSEIKALFLDHRDLQPAELLGQADRLVLTNHYPSYEDLYRNGFVHSRVTAYRERGIRCDVFRMRPSEPVSFHEFEDIDVTTGSPEVLNQMLASGRYKSVLVHFLDATMWEVLQHHIEHVDVTVWVHGAEIQPWHRRAFSYATEEERVVAKMKSDARMTFWRGLLREVPARLKLVFVSHYFAETVMEDLGFRIPEKHYRIIHNPINTDVFRYAPKPAEQRMKVLSIRPYASAIYANDLSARAIEMLASRPWFGDMEFRLIGDGPLFEKTLAPLRQYRNVIIEQRFLTQSEIAVLHRDYGIFLSPSRLDSQGVSRDEAMASGLVPVTNAVAAIPEFVDDTCGILAPGEDAAAMAQGIASLVEDPARFSAMSAAAAARVARQSAKRAIVDAEIKAFE